MSLLKENQQKIFIYGAPGSGKTTYSLKLKKELGYPLVEADYLRGVAEKQETIEQDPFIYLGTTEAYKHFGAPNKENILKGLHAVRKSMSPYINEEISKFEDNLIMESAFLDPEKLRFIGKLVLIITLNENRHSSQYFQHREQNENNFEAFRAARIIQDYLIEEAELYDVQTFVN